MSASAPTIVIFAALLVAGVGLIVLARRGGPDEPRPAVLGSGLAVIFASCAGFVSIVAVQQLSARAARHAEIEAVRAEEDAQAAIHDLIEQGNRLAAEAAAERDAVEATPPPEAPPEAPSEPAPEPAPETTTDESG